MDNQINYQTLISRLEENEMPYGKLIWPNGMQVVLTQRGGRIFGPFLDQDSSCLFWANKAFSDREAFRSFLAAGNWNLGGDRIWIAPEIQYGIHDRNDFAGSYDLQASMDPGQYQLEANGHNCWRLSQDFSMEARVIARGKKDLLIERLIQPVEDPLRNLNDYPELMEEVRFAGYEQIVILEETSQDEIVSEVWSLIQLNPGGLVLIPSVACIEHVDYLMPVDETIMQINPNSVRLKIDGQRQYKVGFKSPHVFGRLGYLNSLERGGSYLIVRNFFNNPSWYYAEEVDRLPGRRGHSIHIYNDNGELGGFGEVECNGQTIGGPTSRSVTTDQLILWIYVGETKKIERIALHLLGIAL
jgi:hypothetical protein